MEEMYKFIDLGLPSGTLWADRNVGASSSSGYGNYYTIDEASSAARSMGSGWRLPTEAELEELNSECIWSWTGSGYKVTGPNGNSIYLPAAGWRDGSSTYDVGSCGYCWSSTPTDSDHVYYLYFSSGYHYVNWMSRSYGYPVRPVTEKTNKDKDAIISLISEEKGMKIVPQNDYELRVDNNEVFVVKKPQYPKTYEECCDICFGDKHHIIQVVGLDDLENNKELFENFIKLKICRDAYWKIAGDEMGLNKPWEPDWCNENKLKYCIECSFGTIDKTRSIVNGCFLAFPTEEMRDAFYENFKDLIEECKELL